MASNRRRSLVVFVKDHPIVALAAYTLFLISTVCVFIKSVGVKHFDYFGVEGEMETQRREIFEQRDKTLKAELDAVSAKKDCQSVEIAALQSRNEVTSLRERLTRCEAAGPVANPRHQTEPRHILPEQWHHEYMPAATGAAVADRLSQLGRSPEDVAVFYDRHDQAFHIWYAGQDRHIRYEYKVGVPSDLGEHPGVNFFKQDAVTLPIGIGGSSPIPIYFRVIS